jgi:hypothetical protein
MHYANNDDTESSPKLRIGWAGGNQTERGAAAQSTLSTIVLTALQRALDPLAWLQRRR